MSVFGCHHFSKFVPHCELATLTHFERTTNYFTFVHQSRSSDCIANSGSLWLFILVSDDNSALFMILFPVTYGVGSKEQRSIVRTFLRNIFNVNVDQILTAVMNEYTDYR